VTQERVAVPSIVDGAGTAERHAAAKLGTGHIEGVAENPEEGHLRTDVHGLGLAVQSEANGHADLRIAGRWDGRLDGQYRTTGAGVR